MPNPFLWGTVAGLLNFIPYAGPTASLILLTSVAIVSFDTVAHVAAVAGSFLALTTLESNVVQPLLVGRRLQLNPMLVFLALWFGGFFWGIAGIVLATPALVALKVVAESSHHGKPLAGFLSHEAIRDPARSATRETAVVEPEAEGGEASGGEGLTPAPAAAKATALS
jgi:predicted PurR-regulated permease PerM